MARVDEAVRVTARYPLAHGAPVQVGFPETLGIGDLSKLPVMPVFTPGWQLGPPDLVVSMSEPFEVSRKVLPSKRREAPAVYCARPN